MTFFIGLQNMYFRWK